MRLCRAADGPCTQEPSTRAPPAELHVSVRRPCPVPGGCRPAQNSVTVVPLPPAISSSSRPLPRAPPPRSRPPRHPLALATVLFTLLLLSIRPPGFLIFRRALPLPVHVMDPLAPAGQGACACLRAFARARAPSHTCSTFARLCRSPSTRAATLAWGFGRPPLLAPNSLLLLPPPLAGASTGVSRLRTPRDSRLDPPLLSPPSARPPALPFSQRVAQTFVWSTAAEHLAPRRGARAGAGPGPCPVARARARERARHVDGACAAGRRCAPAAPEMQSGRVARGDAGRRQPSPHVHCSSRPGVGEPRAGAAALCLGPCREGNRCLGCDGRGNGLCMAAAACVLRTRDAFDRLLAADSPWRKGAPVWHAVPPREWSTGVLICGVRGTQEVGCGGGRQHACGAAPTPARRQGRHPARGRMNGARCPARTDCSAVDDCSFSCLPQGGAAQFRPP